MMILNLMTFGEMYFWTQVLAITGSISVYVILRVVGHFVESRKEIGYGS